jgi:hypothetical protein
MPKEKITILPNEWLKRMMLRAPLCLMPKLLTEMLQMMPGRPATKEDISTTPHYQADPQIKGRDHDIESDMCQPSTMMHHLTCMKMTSQEKSTLVDKVSQMIRYNLFTMKKQRTSQIDSNRFQQ